jgi:hypothetical protein
LEPVEGAFRDFASARAAYEDFKNAPPNSQAPYDCLLMYSGGKDSTYLLSQFVEAGRRVLAYTFDVPFESVRAAENIELAKAKLNATFFLDSDDQNIKRMMQEVFNRPKRPGAGKYLDEKLPCISCRTFFLLRGLLHAYKLGIPHLILCADPQQILTMESDAREMVRSFYREFGNELASELFSGELEQLLFAEEGTLPKIIFPFVEQRRSYDPDRIASEMQRKGLYQSSPLETHCTLFPLLNYYSYKNFDCMFYKLNASSHVRSLTRNKDHDRASYSMRLPRDLDVEKTENELKSVILQLAAGEGDRRAHERALTGVFKDLGATDEAAQFATQNFLDLQQIAADVGIKLD